MHQPIKRGLAVDSLQSSSGDTGRMPFYITTNLPSNFNSYQMCLQPPIKTTTKFPWHSESFASSMLPACFQLEMSAFLLCAYICAGHPWQKQCIEEFISACGSRGGVHNSKRATATGGQSSKRKELCLQVQTQQREDQLELGWDYKLSKPTPIDVFPPASLYLLKVP